LKRQLLKEIKGLKKGDYIKVSWYDASLHMASLSELKNPEILVDEWGVFLGLEGIPKHIVLGKTYVLKDRSWEATCVPVSLIHNLEIIAKRISRTFLLRKYRLGPCRKTVKVKDFG
jgi:hypothetical protein